MDETLDELLSMLPQQETYLEGLQRFSAEHRRLEWLSVRVLVFTLLGEEKEIAYYPSGKPYLADKSASISISHTRGYVSVIIGEAGKEVGIDIEQYGERVHKVAHKYMRTDEPLSSYQGTDTWMPEPTVTNTQSKLFSGERTSPLRTKRQHYPRFDSPIFFRFLYLSSHILEFLVKATILWNTLCFFSPPKRECIFAFFS